MKSILILISVLAFVGCSSKKDDSFGSEVTEPAQQIGDLMASIDEMGGTTGSIANLDKASRKTFARYAPNELNDNLVTKVLMPSVQAVSCTSTASGFNGGFSTCPSGTTVTRTFAGCTVGDIVYTGTVTFVWSGTGVTTCGLNQTGNTITRSPSFTVEGRRGATLTVSKNGATGQQLQWTSGTSPKVFNFTNSDGIRRKFTTASGSIIFDYITTVRAAVVVTGEMRNGRVINSGLIRVQDNQSGGIYCDYSPTNITWGDASCNCPTQGTWQATCSDGKSASLVLTGCGTGTYTLGSDTGTLTFDRCGS